MSSSYSYSSWVEISRSAILHQVSSFKRLAPTALLLPVIKSNAYGHGLFEVLSILDASKYVDGLMVVSLDEALAIRPRTKKDIYILSIWQHDPTQVAKGIRSKVVFPIYDVSSAQWLASVASRIGKKARVQIKLDTGTMRLGFRFDDMASIRRVASNKRFDVRGYFSHFADSESLDETVTKKQDERFLSVIKKLQEYAIPVPLYHTACSAAALRNRSYHHLGIRWGIALYGLWPSHDIQLLSRAKIQLRPVLTWKTRIIQIKDGIKGDSIGYGMSYRMPSNGTIGVIPVGYWDGYDRRLSNSAEVLINGVRCPVRGRVCMNLAMVELPNKGRNMRIGDEVVLIGGQGKQNIPVEELARHMGTINYEVVTRINPLLPRIIVS